MESRWLKAMVRMEEYEKSMGNLRENQLNIKTLIINVVSSFHFISFHVLRPVCP